MELAWQQKVTTIHLGGLRPSQCTVPRVLCQLELNRALGFSLDHGNLFWDPVGFDHIGHGALDRIASKDRGNLSRITSLG